MLLLKQVKPSTSLRLQVKIKFPILYEGFGLKTPASGQDQMSLMFNTERILAGTFSVEENGLYQVVIDKDLGKVAILPVKYWAILGGATPLGWSDTQLPLVGQFSKTEMTFEGTKIVLREVTTVPPQRRLETSNG